MMERILYFSPHLDDAVLSCAGRIASQVEQGKDVWVATLFTGADAESAEAYQGRRHEDERALAILGARILHLGLQDAPYRDAHYQSFTSIIFGTALADHAFLECVVISMQQALNEIKPMQVVLPLAVGGHIDHRLCFDAGQRLKTNARIDHYEDQPYSLVCHSTRLRLRQISRVACIEVDQQISEMAFKSEFSQSFRDSHYVKSYCSNELEIEQAILAHIAQWSGGGQCVAIALSIQEEFDADISARRHRAISCYQSQLPRLFENFDDFQKNFSCQNHQERYWLLTPPRI